MNPKNINIFALGGLGEIGKNTYAIEQNNEIIIIDSGIKFPEYPLGVNYLIPDYTYLERNKSKIKALFITHGHEDHIGGIPFLLQATNVPVIYASGIAINLIESKFKEYHGLKYNLKEYKSDSVIKFNNFEVSFFRTNHSIPDSFGIAVKTNLGYIIHTGDFKFDMTPIGPRAEYSKIGVLGDKGVLLLLSDSTNVLKKQISLSEQVISKSISNMFKDIKGRIIISTFASNVYRIQQIVDASVACNRKVIVFGRSMERVLTIGQELKYIKAPKGTFIKANEFPAIQPKNITIISTGSQGEPLAALSRIAEGTHRSIHILPDDTIIFSSSAIPGNQQHINRTINKLYKAGAKVIINSPLADTHTSGHGSSYELLLMLNLCKPKYFMPIHGEYAMQTKHMEYAIASGIPPENCFLMKNGQVLSISKTKASMGEKIPSGIVYIGYDKKAIPASIVKERKKISDDGVIALTFNISGKQLIGKVDFTSRGFVYMKSSEKMINLIVDMATTTAQQYLNTNSNYSSDNFKDYMSKKIGHYIDTNTETKPLLVIMVIELKK